MCIIFIIYHISSIGSHVGQYNHILTGCIINIPTRFIKHIKSIIIALFYFSSGWLVNKLTISQLVYPLLGFDQLNQHHHHHHHHHHQNHHHHHIT